MKTMSLLLGTIILLSSVSLATSDPDDATDLDPYPELTARVDGVREALGIPGMAAALVRDQELVWAQGFGFADIEGQIAVDPHTPFSLASVTKPVAATLIMQLAGEGLIDLDAAIADYGVSAPGASVVTVRHLLTHTSEGTPGETHVYNGNRFALLGGVIEGATGRTFAEELGHRLLLPLGMMDSAVNPINSWGDRSRADFDDFRRPVGWGQAYDHYPDVYRRLTKPYQLDEQYETVSGMYHLTHNPAAGLLSSVVDLATFDIALDRGELLSDELMAEMFAPAVPTVAGRQDVAYGLGWYVQEWAGHRMLWHTGRWPPSTSALYLKLPDEGLTFVVLANTEGMTTSFQGIGSGDLSRSTLMLTLFEQLVFDVPVIDWMADKDTLVDELSRVDDDDTRLFLEFELWSYRQALAQSGNHDQAAVLVDVDRAAFPGSRLRLDSSYTYTAPATPTIPPVMGASSVATLAYTIIAWLLIVAVSLLVVLSLLLRPVVASVGVWAVALPATVVFGPITPLAVLVNRRAQGSQKLHRGFVAGVLSMTGYCLAWVPAIALLVASGEEPGPVATISAIFVLPFVAGLFLIRVPSLRRESGLSLGTAARVGLFPELLTVAVGAGALLAVTVFFDNRVLSTLPRPMSPFFWGMLSVAGLIGVVLLTLHYLLLLHRGSSSVPFLETTPDRGSAEPRVPRWRDSWWILLVNVAVTIALMAVLG